MGIHASAAASNNRRSQARDTTRACGSGTAGVGLAPVRSLLMASIHPSRGRAAQASNAP